MTMPINRRRFVGATIAGLAASLGTRRLLAQEGGATTPGTVSSSSNVAMDPSEYRPITRPPKPGARPTVTRAESDALEHQLGCMCPCTLDVYTCRTTDFSCSISPAMHRDVLALAQGGYTADEIIASFVQTYGEQVLMAPVKSGFNWAGYIAPFAALGGGVAVVVALMRRWRTAAPVANSSGPRIGVDATPDELARLQAAVRSDAPR